MACETKICPRCNIEQVISCYNKDKQKKDGLFFYCKTCQSERTKLYNTLNRERVRLANKKSYEKNGKKWQPTRNRYQNKKRHTDVSFRLGVTLRGRLKGMLKEGWTGGESVRQLGCSCQELKTWIENQFKEGMNWENWSRYGWHIDHIKPLCAFNLANPEELKQAVHYTNLQPLWAKENLRKSGKYNAI